jgi:aquaporin Z
MSDIAHPSPPAPPTATAAQDVTTAQKLVAEFLGTFVLVFFGVGSVVLISVAASGRLAVADITAIGLSFGIAVMVMVYAVGRVSGGHFNPAVSLGAAIGGRVSWVEALVYMVAQVVGGIVGAAAVAVVAEGYAGFTLTGRMGANSYGTNGFGIAWWGAFVLEAVLTAVFVFVILGVTDIRNEHPALAPLAIGFTLAAVNFVAIPATGASANPARSIGPALFDGTHALKQLWLFILAPLVGGAVSGMLYPLVFGHGSEPVRGSGLHLGSRQPVGVPGYGAPDALQQQWQQTQAPPWASGGGWQPGQSQPAPPQPGQAYPAQSYPGQSYPGQSYPGQGYPGQTSAPAAPPPPTPGSPPSDPEGGHTEIRPPQ